MVCEQCKKPDKPELTIPIVESTGCSAQYFVMNSCMEQNGGNISSCRESWDAFRKCFQEREKFKIKENK